MTLDLFGHKDRDFGTTVRYFLSNLAAAQARAGDTPTIHLLTSSRSHRLNANGVEVYFHRCLQPPASASFRMRFARQFSLSMLRCIRSDQADIVHFHGVLSFQAMFAAVVWRSLQQGIPVVAQEQGKRPVRLLEGWAERYGLRRAHAVLCASPERALDLLTLGARPETQHLVPNGFDPKIFKAITRECRSVKDPFKVLVVSRLSVEKDPLTLADGVCELTRRRGQTNITVIGEGSLKEKFEKRLQKGSTVAKFVDFVSASELANYYQSADVLVLSSLCEGMPQVVLEAMACGLPVVATNISGTRDALGDAGILIPVRDPIALADALEYLADNPEGWLQYREKGLQRVSSFTWDTVAKQIQRIYHGMVKSPITPS